jgi:hypothetical protein
MDKQHKASETNIKSPTTYGKEAYESYRKKEKHREKAKEEWNFGQKKTKVVSDLQYATIIAQLLKNLKFPTNKNKIINYLTDYKSSHEIPREQTVDALSLLQQLPEKHYSSVSEVTEAIDLLQDIS